MYFLESFNSSHVLFAFLQRPLFERSLIARKCIPHLGKIFLQHSSRTIWAQQQQKENPFLRTGHKSCLLLPYKSFSLACFHSAWCVVMRPYIEFSVRLFMSIYYCDFSGQNIWRGMSNCRHDTHSQGEPTKLKSFQMVIFTKSDSIMNHMYLRHRWGWDFFQGRGWASIFP